MAGRSVHARARVVKHVEPRENLTFFGPSLMHDSEMAGALFAV